MGPLQGVKILEIGGIGPGPFCGMMLSDMGADVIRVEKPGQFKRVKPQFDVLNRNRRSVGVDLKKRAGIKAVLEEFGFDPIEIEELKEQGAVFDTVENGSR